jgi:hypothetical protein
MFLGQAIYILGPLQLAIIVGKHSKSFGESKKNSRIFAISGDRTCLLQNRPQGLFGGSPEHL